MGSTPEEIREAILCRYHTSLAGFYIILGSAFAIIIILSLFADPVTTYGQDLANGGGYTISHSMTGLWSNPVALSMIFLGLLYLHSILAFHVNCTRE